ncbi:hypothetical protein R3W88_007721 [Solanum pinnatisectum]|uniref:F-box domain-containing protein n=1 Tax=Solanum pinnatisectum TaxID=50273 RepID=A0AAV9M9B6_9SOLN|nr:hypothetical protein R3W88_007721 [Solanum pinnatisectum]
MKVEDDNEESLKQQLPDEIIYQILTLLPLSSLFKFKSVCKLWNTLYLHPHFTKLRDELRSLHLIDVKINAAMLKVPFATISRSIEGLCLQKTVSSCPLRYRIYSPTFHQMQTIPNPQNPSIYMALEFVSSFNQEAVKLVSIHKNEHYSLGYEILALRIGIYQSTYTWRAVKVPPYFQRQRQSRNIGKRKKRIDVVFRKELAYCLWYIETGDFRDDVDLEIDVLDMVNEKYIGHTTFPAGFVFPKFSVRRNDLFDWKGMLAFDQQVKDALHVLVFDRLQRVEMA